MPAFHVFPLKLLYLNECTIFSWILTLTKDMEPVLSKGWFSSSSLCVQNRPDQELCWFWIPGSALDWGPGNIPHAWGFHHEVETVVPPVGACLVRKDVTAQCKGYHDVCPRVNPEQIVYRVVIALWTYNYIERTTIKKNKREIAAWTIWWLEVRGRGETTMCLVCLKFSNNTSLVRWI